MADERHERVDVGATSLAPRDGRRLQNRDLLQHDELLLASTRQRHLGAERIDVQAKRQLGLAQQGRRARDGIERAALS